MDVHRIIRPEIAALTSYHVAPSVGFIKLDAMENPHDFPVSLREGLQQALACAALNRYPSASAAELVSALRRAMSIPDELDVLLGNGSDEIIQLIALACAKPGASLLSVAPAFVMFRLIATVCGLRYVGVPLNADFRLNTDAMLSAIEKEKPAVTFIAYPNNPTGNLFDPKAIRKIIAAAAVHDGLVVIDEAYYAFSSHSFLGEIAQYPNAVLMRTVSKLGLAGLRLGLLIGRREWLAEFDKLRLPYNINALTQAAGLFACAHIDALHSQAADIVRERARVVAALATLPGVTCFPSEANFVLVRVPNAQTTFEALLSARILVKNTSETDPLLHNTLRLTIGTPQENDALLTALATFLKSTPTP